MFNKSSLSEQVEDALREEITLGRLRPGQRVSVSDYQVSWKISSTPFRDAVRSLERQGFLTVEPRRGVYVAPMNAATVKEIFDLRIALECMAIELATPLVPAAEAERVRDAYRRAQSEAKAGDRSGLTDNDRLVHDLAREHCGNVRLQRLLAGQTDLIRWAQNAIVNEMPAAYELALPEHIAIMDAVCAREAGRAAAAMRRHLESSRARLESQLAHQVNGV
jgi:DNA-binding GntR family transcriptional regulator